MRLFGLSITREKAAPAYLSPVYDNPRAWWPVIREGFPGAWQRNIEERPESALSYYAVARCISLISSDIAKMRICLVAQGSDSIWTEIDSPAFSPVLRKPNRYQNRIQFILQWIESKLIHGNAYILKERDDRNIVVSLYVLDPRRVVPLVAPDGAVYYNLSKDDLAGITDDLQAVPASEIIHDRWNAIYHPLIGMSPITACGLAATQGLKIQRDSSSFFGNGSNPGGILTAPGKIEDATAKRLKEHWDNNYSGQNVGKVAVLGDGLKYEKMRMTAVDSQMLEQLNWTAEAVCSAFGVPGYKIGVGPAPLNNNIEALDGQYYSQCLQIHIESAELCLDEGLGLDVPKDGTRYGTEFELDNLLRMDTATLIKAEAEAVKGSIKAPNEARKRLNLPPTKGGENPLSQQQNYSLAALAERDANKPFSKPVKATAAKTMLSLKPPEVAQDDEALADKGMIASAILRKELGLAA